MFEVFEEDRPKKAILLAVLLPGVDDEALRRSVEELRRLAKTLGVEVTGEITQRRDTLDPGMVVGKGKVTVTLGKTKIVFLTGKVGGAIEIRGKKTRFAGKVIPVIKP